MLLSKAHDNLTNQLSPALLYGGKSEAWWLAWGPSASPWPRGNWNKACLTQGLCSSEHIMCDVSPRCWKDRHVWEGVFKGEPAEAELGWKGSHGHGDLLGTGWVSWWKCHSQHNSHVSKADSAGVLGRWGRTGTGLEKDITPSPLLISAPSLPFQFPLLSSVKAHLLLKPLPGSLFGLKR